MPTEELVLSDKKVILVGTAHVSQESVTAVEDAIMRYKPDAVAVELDLQRFQALKEEKKWDETEISHVISSDRVYLFILQILLANFQRKIGEDVGVKPGAEMIKAIEIAEREGIGVVLADRDIGVTLKRAKDQMTFKEKAKILFGFVTGVVEGQEIDKELVEKMKEKDVLSELMDELSREAPSIKKVLVDERDEYIAHSIHDAKADCVVAVVGAGHMEGIRRNLIDADGKIFVSHVQQIEGVDIGAKKKSRKVHLLSAIIIGLFFLFLFAGFMKHGFEMTLSMLAMWWLITGSLAALGAALSLAHPLTILTAFLAAPFTTLHPAIAAGWVAGYVEMKIRKPRVIDFKNLMKLKSVSDYFTNRVTRLLFVVAFTNIGASIGVFIALPYLASLI